MVADEWHTRCTAAPSFGYGYQWWLGPKPENPDLLSADFAAIGVYGQMVYVRSAAIRMPP